MDNASEFRGDRDRAEVLRDRIRQAAKELMALDNAAGLSFSFDATRTIYIGMDQELITDRDRGSVTFNGKICCSAEQLWAAMMGNSETP